MRDGVPGPGDLLEHLYEVVQLARAIDDAPRTFDTDHVLTRAEIHTVSDLASHPDLGVTGLAALQGVTKGAASQMVSRLARKGLVRKTKAGGREVLLELTDAGERAHEAHMRFHAAISAHLSRGYPEQDMLVRDVAALRRLHGLMEAWRERERAAADDGS